MIRSFGDRKTAKLFGGEDVRAFRGIRAKAERRLQILDSAASLDDLRALNSNRLEALVGDRVGQYSIRIDRQWRLCFRWGEQGPEGVEIVDYH